MKIGIVSPSAPLSTLLESFGIAAKLVDGLVRAHCKRPGLATTDQNCHYWIELEDGRILDATADQFRTPNGERMPPVYLGDRPAWYQPVE